MTSGQEVQFSVQVLGTANPVIAKTNGEGVATSTITPLAITDTGVPVVVIGSEVAEKLFAGRDPIGKTHAFRATVEGGVGAKVDIAFFKFCYVDISRETDVGKMFESYKATVRRVKMKYPGLALVHVTIPLTSSDYTLKVRLKNIVKRILGRKDENFGRSELNERIRKEYGASDPIFDLAALESTSPEGDPVTITYQGKKYPSMYPGYTTDGGHLNGDGKRVAAVGLLETLLRVAGKEGTRP